MNKKDKVKNIFDSISQRYDFLNHLLSFGVDFYWRHKALKLTGINSGSVLLDVACGTGDFSIAARKKGVTEIFGADLSKNMLLHFIQKADWIKGRLLQSVAEDLPFKNNSFTNITVAFGVRNFYDIRKGLKEFYRVLQPGGKATILEFQMPENFVFRTVYNFYFKNILPVVGKLISKDKEAYTYLPDSVQQFDKEISLKNILEECGFGKVAKYSLTFGIVQVVIAEK